MEANTNQERNADERPRLNWHSADELYRQVCDKNPSIRKRAAEAFRHLEIPDDDMPRVLRWLDSLIRGEDDKVYEAALITMSQLIIPDLHLTKAFELLSQYLKNEDHSLHLAAATNLGHWPIPNAYLSTALKMLAQLVTDDEWDTRKLAVRALGHVLGHRAIPISYEAIVFQWLSGLVGDGIAQVRAEAARSLGHLFIPDGQRDTVVQWLVTLNSDKDTLVREAAIKTSLLVFDIPDENLLYSYAYAIFNGENIVEYLPMFMDEFSALLHSHQPLIRSLIARLQQSTSEQESEIISKRRHTFLVFLSGYIKLDLPEQEIDTDLLRQFYLTNFEHKLRAYYQSVSTLDRAFSLFEEYLVQNTQVAELMLPYHGQVQIIIDKTIIPFLLFKANLDQEFDNEDNLICLRMQSYFSTFKTSEQPVDIISQFMRIDTTYARSVLNVLMGWAMNSAQNINQQGSKIDILAIARYVWNNLFGWLFNFPEDEKEKEFKLDILAILFIYHHFIEDNPLMSATALLNLLKFKSGFVETEEENAEVKQIREGNIAGALKAEIKQYKIAHPDIYFQVLYKIWELMLNLSIKFKTEAAENFRFSFFRLALNFNKNELSTVSDWILKEYIGTGKLALLMDKMHRKGQLAELIEQYSEVVRPALSKYCMSTLQELNQEACQLITDKFQPQAGHHHL